MASLVENLTRRADIVRRVRAFFDARGFVEVTTPVRIAAPAPEPHIDCPPCGAGYLRASPELQMKKLLAFGMDRIYQIGPCFREGESGARHSPEFTMIEWYRRDATAADIAADAEALLRDLLPTRQGPAHISVRDAYARWAGWDPWTDWDQDRFDFDMAAKIEPALPSGLVFLEGYPRQAASLARLDGDVAERWELYCDGVELANCFSELCDGEEQRRRFLATREERRALGESDYPLDEEFLGLLPLVRCAAGVAVGVDRLVAVALGESDIHAVMCPA
ncbi:MAG: EF-P lysine aminoacylase GenX [Kiritimatiellae bacterium]|nr:EF-P lysine aminoacylase GenX [Kiritimatiellia bacterium]